MANISSRELISIFEKELSVSATYHNLGYPNENPCHIMLDGVEYYIYVKNLSSAHFKNDDVWRAQMTGIDILEKIKATDTLFILLGYDEENDVYATWNPHMVKQRIGTAKSPSLYSRLSLQKEVGKTKEFKRYPLANDGEVLIFPRSKVLDFMGNIDTFFPDTSDYVAMGSKRRVEANTIYKILNNTKNIKGYGEYLLSEGFSKEDVQKYCECVSRLIKENIISRYRKAFLAFDSLDEYEDAVDKFLSIDEVSELDEKYNHLISAALPLYIFYLQELSTNDSEESSDNKLEVPEINNTEDAQITERKQKQEEGLSIDWEQKYSDGRGHLTKIANPTLLEKLRPYLDAEYPSLPPAYNIVDDFYGDRFKDMELKDWGKLFKEINWKAPAESAEPDPCISLKRKKQFVLRVSFPDGEVIMDRNVSNTFTLAIDKIGPEKINALHILVSGYDMVSDTNYEQDNLWQHRLNNGQYVIVKTSTPRKQELLQEISDRLHLGLLIDKVSLADFERIKKGELPITFNREKTIEGKPSNFATPKFNSSRKKIRVQFPDGTISEENQVVNTYLKVIEFAGPDKVRSLNIVVANDNLITPTWTARYDKALKKVSNGMYANTCSSTQKKFVQLNEINEKLKLNLLIFLV